MRPPFVPRCVLLAWLLGAAAGTTPGDTACNCEAICTQIVALQREEIARLQAEVGLLRGGAPRRAAAAEALCGDYVVTSNAELQALQGCRTVGDLTIRGVTSLASLRDLESAENISILENGELQSLSGLEKLTNVAGKLLVQGNSVLSSLLGLQGLRAAGTVVVRQNAGLESVAGLGGLDTIGDLEFNLLGKLESFAGLENLRKVDGTLYIHSMGQQFSSLSGLQGLRTAGTLRLQMNELTSLAGLEGLEALENLKLESNRKLESLTGLENLMRVDGQLYVDGLEALPSLSGLQGLRSAGELRINGGANILSSLAGLEGLEALENMTVAYDTSLESLSGVEKLKHLNKLELIDSDLGSLGLRHLETIRNVSIKRCHRLESLAGLEDTRVETLRLDYNHNLMSIAELKNRGRVMNSLYISDNYKLRSLSGLEGLEVVKELSVKKSKLEDLTGLEDLSSVEALRIEHNEYDFTSLAGLESLANASLIQIDGNKHLASVAGLQSLTNANVLHISGSDHLTSLAGLESLTNVSVNLSIMECPELVSTALQSLRNAKEVHLIALGKLESVTLSGLVSLDVLHISGTTNLRLLSGFENLESVDMLWLVDNKKIKTFDAFRGLRSLGVPHVRSNPRLHSFAGLQSLTSIRVLHASAHVDLRSLAGLGNVTHVGELRVGDSVLENLVGLKSLTRVEVLHIQGGNANLKDLSGLESLQFAGHVWIRQDKLTRLVGTESLEHVHRLTLEDLSELRTVVGLRSLAFVSSGVHIQNCTKLRSLSGLGALRKTSELFLGGANLEYLGGPFASDATVEMIRIDDASWPPCITPHERAALVSVVDNMPISNLPEITKWPNWRPECQREHFGTFRCTRGQPCIFSLAGKESTYSRVFISGRFSGCGLCTADHHQGNAAESGLVELGYSLKDEEGGLHSVCRCVEDEEELGPVAQLMLRGPRLSGVTKCLSGHKCTLRLEGEALEPTDHVVLMTSCSGGDPRMGFAASWAVETAGDWAYLLHDPAWRGALPTRYQVCWRAPCTSGLDGPECAAQEEGYIHVGEVDLRGAFPRNYSVVLGDYFTAPNFGFEVSTADWMRLRHRCGEAYEGAIDALDANSSSMVFDFGRLTEDRVQAGVHQLCWCQAYDGAECNLDQHFMAEAGVLRILCPVGKEFAENSGRCRECPAGKERREPGLEPCTECPAGQFSPRGVGGCEGCQDGTTAELPGSSTCVACWAWERADDEATGCLLNPAMLILLGLFFLSVGTLSAVLVHATRRQLRIVDVSPDQGSTMVTILGSHNLSNFGRSSFPAAFRNTGHPGLDKTSEPFRVTVRDAARLELLTKEEESIDRRLDTSMGILTVPFPYDFYHQGWPLPMAFILPVLLVVVLTLGGLVLANGMPFEGFLGAAAAALVFGGSSAAVRWRPRDTPLARRLSEFRVKLAKLPPPKLCEKGPGRALALGKLHEVLEFFHDFIRDRTAYYLDGNVFQALTRERQISYAELVGPEEVEWFVSHFWGTAFAHFCTALKKHAETSCGERHWSTLRYWVCFCSNNQFNIQGELGTTWAESSFYLTLKSGLCHGTCMVLDDQALPLTRIWCIFELLQTVKLEREMANFQGLLLCTSSGVLNTGSGSVEVAMALAEKVVNLDLASAQSSSERDGVMIRQQVIKEMGSFAALQDFVRHEVRNMLTRAQSSANRQFAVVLAHVDGNVDEPPLNNV